jgi:hypothetical protein
VHTCVKAARVCAWCVWPCAPGSLRLLLLVPPRTLHDRTRHTPGQDAAAVPGAPGCVPRGAAGAQPHVNKARRSSSSGGSTAPHSTAPHRTAQHSTAQHSTAARSLVAGCVRARAGGVAAAGSSAGSCAACGCLVCRGATRRLQQTLAGLQPSDRSCQACFVIGGVRGPAATAVREFDLAGPCCPSASVCVCVCVCVAWACRGRVNTLVRVCLFPLVALRRVCVCVCVSVLTVCV